MNWRLKSTFTDDVGCAVGISLKFCGRLTLVSHVYQSVNVHAHALNE